MAKTMESFGIPTVHICSIVPISQTVGANRIVPAIAIPYPTGNPDLTKEDEVTLRKSLLMKALNAISTDIEEPTVFD